jgi:hypothetical protein
MFNPGLQHIQCLVMLPLCRPAIDRRQGIGMVNLREERSVVFGDLVHECIGFSGLAISCKNPGLIWELSYCKRDPKLNQTRVGSKRCFMQFRFEL